jgi:hypothetical protein
MTEDRRGPESSPPWVWALVVAFALVTLTVGAIVGMVTTKDDAPAAAPSDAGETTVLEPPGETASVAPPTVSVPGITELPETGLTDTGSTVTVPPATTPTTTVPPATTAPPVAGTWPSGESGFTLVLASVVEAQGRTEADAAAQRATTAGLPEVGVLRSSDFSSLRPGYWVAYSGVYDTDAEARAALATAVAAGFPDAYPRRVAG